MSEVYSERFPVIESEKRHQTAKMLASIALRSSKLTDDFSRIERVPRYENGKRENDVEHSYMLSIAAPEMANALNLDLNIDKIRAFSIVHDLLEVKVGDVATFSLTPEEIKEKERLEQDKLKELLQELDPLTRDSLEAYEKQDTREAIFVRMVDKLLPIAVDTTGSGPRVISEDYGVSTIEDLIDSHDALHARIVEKFSADEPDLVAAHAVLCEIFEDKYRETQIDNSPEQKERSSREVERKYKVDLHDLPSEIDLNLVKKTRLEQGYLAVGKDGSETRIRSFNNERYELTIKSAGSIDREEQNLKITKEIFESLWSQTKDRRIVKVRHYIPYENHTIELDIYEENLQGLVTAEVEFEGRPADAIVKANTFTPPSWFGQDVSEDLRYKNRNLAEHSPDALDPLGFRKY